MKKLTGLLLIVLLISLACNAPRATPTIAPDLAFTAAAQTVEARMTELAFSLASTATASSPILPTATLPPLPTLLPTIPPTSVPSTPTNTPLCDLAQFVRDVTVPDGTEFAPGATFTKTWRLRNIGTCTWSGYSVVFDSGNAMNGTSPSPLPTVAPGQEVDVSIDMVAPSTTGTYRGYWRIRNASGVLIPVAGGYEGKSFFVEIKVRTASPGFDLYTRAPEAEWLGSSPSGPAVTLTFGGPDTDPNGFVMYRPNYKLEDGSTPARVLETHPMWVDGGMISGRYPPYTVNAGDRLKTRLGFLAKADGSCGAGDVKFQINYKESGSLHPLGEWIKSCNGSLITVDLDLSSLVGHTVQFVLAVAANGSSAQDWAVWINPRIEPAP
ncbi:MAG: NBR1-Ig-like domain-containing protein [Anaerolineales bacterium]